MKVRKSMPDKRGKGIARLLCRIGKEGRGEAPNFRCI